MQWHDLLLAILMYKILDLGELLALIMGVIAVHGLVRLAKTISPTSSKQSAVGFSSSQFRK